jgi:hypothetical protein
MRWARTGGRRRSWDPSGVAGRPSTASSRFRRPARTASAPASEPTFAPSTSSRPLCSGRGRNGGSGPLPTTPHSCLLSTGFRARLSASCPHCRPHRAQHGPSGPSFLRSGGSLRGSDGAPRAASHFECRAVCGGTYEITDATAQDLSLEQRRLLSGAVRHGALRGETLKLDSTTVLKILSDVPSPSLAGQADLLLEYLEAKLGAGRKPVRLDPRNNYSVIYGTHPMTCIGLRRHLSAGSGSSARDHPRASITS